MSKNSRPFKASGVTDVMASRSKERPAKIVSRWSQLLNLNRIDIKATAAGSFGIRRAVITEERPDRTTEWR